MTQHGERANVYEYTVKNWKCLKPECLRAGIIWVQLHRFMRGTMCDL